MLRLQFSDRGASENWKKLIADKNNKKDYSVEIALARSFYYLTTHANQRKALARLSA